MSWLDELTEGMTAERAAYWRAKAEDEALEARQDAAETWWRSLTAEEQGAELALLDVERDEDGLFVGQVREHPAAISQGETLADLTSNLRDALDLIEHDDDDLA